MGGDTKAIHLNLDVLREPVSFRIVVANKPARLANIVPLAREISDEITHIVLEKNRRDGDGEIHCRKGCGMCCRRNLVPLSVPEAFKLRQEILSRPEPQRSKMLQAWLLAARHIFRKRLPKMFMDDATPPHSMTLLNKLSSWYVSLKLCCPFLSEGICAIYEHRPLACREYFVKGDARACKGKDGVGEVVDRPVAIIEALSKLGSELEGTNPQAVMLPLVLPWFEHNQQRYKRTWPAQMMVEQFVEIIKSMAAESSYARPECCILTQQV